MSIIMQKNFGIQITWIMKIKRSVREFHCRQCWFLAVFYSYWLRFKWYLGLMRWININKTLLSMSKWIQQFLNKVKVTLYLCVDLSLFWILVATMILVSTQINPFSIAKWNNFAGSKAQSLRKKSLNTFTKRCGLPTI